MKIKDIQLFYKMEIDEIKQELSKMPDGYLAQKGSTYYETTGTTQKGITKDRQKMKQLARKAYLLKRLGHIERNFSLIEKILPQSETEDLIEIIRELPPVFQTLPVDYFFHPSVHDKMGNAADRNERNDGKDGNSGTGEKGNETSIRNSSHNEGLIYITSSGIRVRSKSERTIADALDYNRIPYRYEAELIFDNISRCPDFTIYRPSDGKTVLWEHFGLMNRDEYRQKMINKLSLYNQHGFSPFDNLICTYEQNLRNPAYIQTIIELFFLQ